MDTTRPATAVDRLFAARPRPVGPRWPAALVVLAGLVAGGCGERIDDIYGRQRGPGASASVNGTAVLAEMFVQAGHEVSTWRAVSPRLDSADCIVWFPDDFAPPPKPVREGLERWLTERPNRTLVYVGRDFDAAVWYWDRVFPQVPAAQRKEAARRRALARGRFMSRRGAIPADEDCGWFIVKGKYQARKVRTLQGAPRWLESIDPSKLEMELCGRIDRPKRVGQAAVPPDQVEVLLSSEGDLLVSRQPWFVYEEISWQDPAYWEDWEKSPDSWDDTTDWGPAEIRVEPAERGAQPGEILILPDNPADWPLKFSQREPLGESQLIVVANGSFLLNLMLVNREHRKLAGKLIGEVQRCGGRQQQVIFLESGPGGPPVRDHDPAKRGPSGLEALLAWPTWWMFAHLAFAGILLMLSRWPIFGIPRELPPEDQPDFGRHIEALGELLRRTGDRAYAVSRVLHYRQMVRGESHPAQAPGPTGRKPPRDTSPGATAGRS